LTGGDEVAEDFGEGHCAGEGGGGGFEDGAPSFELVSR
jgi:hypothetical protein